MKKYLHPPAVFLCFRDTEWTLDIIILFVSFKKRHLATNEWNQRKLQLTMAGFRFSRKDHAEARTFKYWLGYTFNGYFLENDHKDVRVIKWFLGLPNLRRSTPFYIFMNFLPDISLLTLRRFVAEVRWLFPESRQKKREIRKQRNTDPWR